jgi:hypothetical protein
MVGAGADGVDEPSLGFDPAEVSLDELSASGRVDDRNGLSVAGHSYQMASGQASGW